MKKILSPALLVTLFVLSAAFLRLWNIEGTLMFLGDQGRDAIIVARIFTQKDLIFIGPASSVGNIYLGPLYYYFMVPWLWLSYPSPLGPAYAVAILGVITVWLTYKLGKDLIGQRAAVFASFFVGFSWMLIKYSRFSWNPNPEPIVALIMMWATYQAWRRQIWYWVIATISFSVLIQLHYLTLLTAISAGLIWFTQLITFIHHKQFKKISQLIVVTALCAVIFVTSLVPLLLFDYRHDWLNTRAFVSLTSSPTNFKQGAQEGFVRDITKVIKETHGRSMHIFFEHITGAHRTTNTLLVSGVVVFFLWILSKRQSRATFYGEVTVGAYIAAGIIGTSFYQHTVFDHYILFLMPAVFLIFGMVLNWLWGLKWGKFLALILMASFLALNAPHYPLKTTTTKLSNIQQVTDSIYQRVKPGEVYDIVLFSGTHDIYGQNYRYFLMTTDRKPIMAETNQAVDTLFIINEDKRDQSILTDPIWQIVVFPNKHPQEVYAIPNGPEITVLRR